MAHYQAPLFSNQIQADLFELEHTFGPFKVLPRTDGYFVVFDTRAPTGKGLAAGPYTNVSAAHEACRRLSESLSSTAK